MPAWLTGTSALFGSNGLGRRLFCHSGCAFAPSLLRDSGLMDWRAVLMRLHRGKSARGIFRPEVLGESIGPGLSASVMIAGQAIWEVLDRVARTVMERVAVSEPQF